MIRLGSAVVNADGTVALQRPASATGSFKAVRLTNYTASIIVIGNINPDDSGTEEYLLPLQQNVYGTNIKGSMPTFSDVSLGSTLNVDGVLVEWSTDPDRDFGKRQYPTTVSSGGFAAPSGTIFQMPLVDATVTYTIPANPFRTRLYLANYCGASIHWSSTDGGWNAAPTILDGTDRTLFTGITVYLRPTVDGSFIEVVEEFVTPTTL